MDKEKITIIGGHKFFVRGDGSSGIVPNDDVICTKTQLTDEEAEAEIKQYSTQMRFYGMVNEISKLQEDLKVVKKQAEDLGKKIGEALEGLNEIN